MTKEYFTPVDYDKEFPPEVKSTTEVAKVVKNTTKLLNLERFKTTIEEELVKIAAGQSKLTPYAIQFNRKNTPFCLNLFNLNESSSIEEINRLSFLAFNDFGARFRDFVKETIEKELNK